MTSLHQRNIHDIFIEWFDLNISIFLFSQGNYKAAQSMLDEALSKCRVVFGRTHPNTLHTQINLGGLYYFCRKYDKARSLLEEVAIIGADVWGETDKRVVGVVNTLNKIYQVADTPMKTANEIETISLADIRVSFLFIGTTKKNPISFEESNRFQFLAASLFSLSLFLSLFLNFEPFGTEARVSKYAWFIFPNGCEVSGADSFSCFP
jgi:tetratricopeptide (TPR) repeat protein